MKRYRCWWGKGCEKQYVVRVEIKIRGRVTTENKFQLCKEHFKLYKNHLGLEIMQRLNTLSEEKK